MLDQPSLTLEKVFKETATEVAYATTGRHDPWITSSVEGDFFFREGKAAESFSARCRWADIRGRVWQSIADSESAVDYETYLKHYPNGTFAQLAEARVAVLKRKQIAAVRPPPAATPKETPVVGVYLKRYAPVKTFKDCDPCPEMVVILVDSFRVGDLNDIGADDEKPVHEVKIGCSLLWVT